MPDASTHESGQGVVSRFFEVDASRDVEAILSIFLDDAVVIDEGREMAGKR